MITTVFASAVSAGHGASAAGGWTAAAYLVASILFILALRGLSSPETSRQGNTFGIIGMAIAIVTTLLSPGIFSYVEILAAIAVGGAIGYIIAQRIAMTAMPELVAAFHSLVGLAAVFVAAAAFLNPGEFGITNPITGAILVSSRIEMSLGAAIGAITFSGSVIAFLKLSGRMSGSPIILPARHAINLVIGLGIIGLIIAFALSNGAASGGGNLFWLILALSFVIGFLLIVPIGGADMPVVVSMLNSYSGWAAAGIGFTLGNTALIITGALVGSSGAILSYIMCKGMNRSFISVILGGFGGESAGPAGDMGDKTVKQGSAEDAAYLMKNAGSVIIVPGYGMAVA
ncbi:MAG: NAD(P)(+) transhydrogenase (Re/Si-specific) subunit beta, partial [Pseudomonadota bacterium]